MLELLQDCKIWKVSNFMTLMYLFLSKVKTEILYGFFDDVDGR